MDNKWVEFLIVAVTVLFGEHTLKFFANKQKDSDKVQFRNDLKGRVKNLEDLLIQEREQNKELMQQVLSLTEEVASLRTKVEFLEQEKARLQKS